MAFPPFLVSMERGGRLVMRLGTGNQSNGYVGTTLCLLSLLFHTNSIKKHVNLLFFSTFSDITKASLSFLISMKGGAHLVMRLGTGNEYVGTTLCLSSLLMTETAGILFSKNIISIRWHLFLFLYPWRGDRPSGNENRLWQSKQWLRWDHSLHVSRVF